MSSGFLGQNKNKFNEACQCKNVTIIFKWVRDVRKM